MNDKQKKINKVNQLSSLVQYRDKSPEEINAIAIEKLAKCDINIASCFTDTKERKIAKELLDKYLEDYVIESIADKNTLKEIIYYEVVQIRLQDKLNELYKSNTAVPMNMIDVMHKNSDVIIKMKGVLGVNKSKNEQETPYDAFSHLKERFKKWLVQNQGSRTLVCPHCSKMILLKIRTEIWESQKHPFFMDKILANKHLIAMFIEKKLTRDDVAKILETSPDYIDWLVERWGNKLIPHNNEETLKEDSSNIAE